MAPNCEIIAKALSIRRSPIRFWRCIKMDRNMLEPERVTIMLAAIRNSLAQADKIVNRWYHQNGPTNDEEPLVAYYVEKAFAETLVLLECAGVLNSFRLVEALNTEARKDYAKVYEYEGDLFLVWPEKLRHFLDALQHAFGETETNIVTKDITDILRSCEYVVTDRTLFPVAPAQESDVHDRIEGILRAIFPDLLRKPHIDKPIKGFQPDTGLPSIKTLVEYKFVVTKEDVKRVSDELLADTRGYVSKKWSHIICVIYETARIEPERKWQQHLRDCGLTEGVSLIVLRGETSSKVRRTSRKP
jgi:hypothetical protein